MCNLPGGFHPVQKRHGEVQQDHIWPKPFRLSHGLLAIFRFADYVHISRCLQQRPKSCSNNGVIVSH